ncbi:hypothetical protein DFH06DRAFT_1402769 [Mycena polygramma]|nr:hypothetical protein DFH06DRAFT_1402769 [Mycena polygramma]
MSAINLVSSPENVQKRTRRCRKCQMPMKGHRAENCIAVQETGLLATPPVTPTNPAANGCTRDDDEIAVGMQWVNQTWNLQPAAPTSRLMASLDVPPLIPTVLADEDGNTIPESHDVAAEASDADSNHLESPTFRTTTPMAQVMDQAHALRLCDPVLSIVQVSVRDLPRMQATAGQSELCTSIVRTPWTSPRFKDEFKPGLNWEEQKNVWVVVGSDSTLVQRTADLQQQYEKVPGAMKDDVVVVQATYKHIIIASTVSTLVVLGVVSLFV